MKKFRSNWLKRVRRTRKPLSQSRPWHRWADDEAVTRGR